MSQDRQTKSNTSKPLTPALSSNFRNVRSPITPRVAGSPTPSPIVSSRQNASARSKSPGKSEQPGTNLNGNITPRSGQRKSRVGTDSPLTPAQPRVLNAGTRSRASSGNEAQKPTGASAHGLGLTSPRLVANTPTLAKTSSSTSVPMVAGLRRASAAKSMVDTTSKDNSAKFFLASEAKSTVGSPGVTESRYQPPRPGQFFVGSQTMPASVDHTRIVSEADTRFFRADDVVPTAQSKRPQVPHLPLQRLNGPPVQTDDPRHTSTPPQSPVKGRNPISQQPVSPRKYVTRNTPSPQLVRTIAERPKSISSAIDLIQYPSQAHRKSMSASSVTSSPPRIPSESQSQIANFQDLRRVPTNSPRVSANNLLSPEALSPRSASLASTNTVQTTLTSDTELSESASSSVLASFAAPSSAQEPTSATSQRDEATTARRERKVLDLEISNSSLLAINKTLERELRKQNVELRRFRRLSRSGRLSLATTNRTVSEQSHFSLDTVTELDGDEDHMSDFDHDSDEELLDDDESLFSNESSSVKSPGAQARQRTRDEKRLMQDLSKHQQLLLDSQKLSQSIRRCLTCTDDLIREGNKALEYRVGIGDVKLGGKVLSDDELDERGLVDGNDELQSRQGLLSPTIAKANLSEAQLWADPAATAIASNEPRNQAEFTSLDDVTSMLESMSAELKVT